MGVVQLDLAVRQDGRGASLTSWAACRGACRGIHAWCIHAWCMQGDGVYLDAGLLEHLPLTILLTPDLDGCSSSSGGMRYWTRSVRWPTPALSSRSMGETPRAWRSSAEAEATVGGSWRVSPTMMSCSALAAARAHTSAGSVACEVRTWVEVRVSGQGQG